MARSASELQDELSLTDAQYTRLGLSMNTDKSEGMRRTVSGDEPQIMFWNNTLREVPHFTYWGSIISNTFDLDRELNSRIQLS